MPEWKTVMLPWWIQPYGPRSILENHCDLTQSAAESRNGTWNSIMQGGSHTSFLCRNSADLSGAKLMSDGLKDSENEFYVQLSIFQFVFRKNGLLSLKSAKASICEVMRHCLQQGRLAYEGTIDVETHIGRDIFCHQGNDFSHIASG